MAIGFGPGYEMQKTVKSQRSAKIKRSLKESSEITSSGKTSKDALTYKTASPELLEQMHKQRLKEKKQHLIITAGILFLVVAIYFIL